MDEPDAPLREMLTTPSLVLNRCADFYYDIAVVTACFCINSQCHDWFINLHQTSKTEVIFVFRALFYKFIEIPTARLIFCQLISAQNVCSALDRFDSLLALNLLETRPAASKQWTHEDDIMLFACLLQDKLALLKAEGKSSRTIRRRLQHWIRCAKYFLSFTPEDIIVEEFEQEMEESEDPTVEKQKAESEGDDSHIVDVDVPFDVPFPVATRGRKNVEAALEGRRLKFQRKNRLDQSLKLARAQKKVTAAVKEQEKLKELLTSKEGLEMRNDRCADGPNLIRRALDFAENREYHAQPYPGDVRSFWILIYTTSPHVFKLLTEMMNGPSLSTMKKWMNAEKNALKNELFNLEHVTDIASRWINKWGGTDDIFTLSYDACKIDEDLVIDEHGRVTGTMHPVVLEADPIEYKTNTALYQKLWEEQISRKNLATHAFVFILTPVSTAKGFPIHILYTNTGSATDLVFNCIHEIPVRLARLGVRIKFLASDSDNKYRSAFNNQFRYSYYQLGRIYMMSESGKLRGLEALELPTLMCCNDIPHILKRWRSRLVRNQQLFVSADAEEQWRSGGKFSAVNSNALKEANPNIPSSAFRSGAIVSMDDSYPAMMFTVENLLAAWDRGALDLFVFLLPPVCAQVVFRNNVIMRHQRMSIAYLGWFLCMYYFCYIEGCGTLCRRFQWPLFTKELTVDLANALLCQMNALCEVGRAYKTSKISSTISEHYFSRMRRTMGPDQSVSNFTRIFLRNIICDLNDSQMTENLQAPKRLFHSAQCEDGVISPDPKVTIEVRDFVCALFAKCSVSFSCNAQHQTVFTCPSFYDLENSCVIQWFRQLNQAGVRTFKKFTVHAGQTRVRRIYGRAILSRFTTAAKMEENSQETIPEHKWSQLEQSLSGD